MKCPSCGKEFEFENCKKEKCRITRHTNCKCLKCYADELSADERVEILKRGKLLYCGKEINLSKERVEFT